MEAIENSALTAQMQFLHSALELKKAPGESPENPSLLRSALERLLPITLQNDVGRFTLDNASQRRQWIDNIAQPRMDFSPLLAKDAKHLAVIAELVAKWRLNTQSGHVQLPLHQRRC